jgi:hypothetical protein
MRINRGGGGTLGPYDVKRVKRSRQLLTTKWKKITLSRLYIERAENMKLKLKFDEISYVRPS